MTAGTQEKKCRIGMHEVAFIDTSIVNFKGLQEGVRGGVDVVLIDAAQDGLAQIAAVLAKRRDVEAIHIFCHGAPGALHLGSNVITESSLASKRAELALIRSALADHADLLLYGCNVAQGARGSSFINALSAAVGANVAASDDPTGSAPLGGDWDLEVSTGMIGARNGLSASAQAAFSGLLNIASDNFDSYNLILSNGREAQLTVGTWVFASSRPVNIAVADGIELPVWLNNDGGGSDRAVIMNFSTDGQIDPVVTGSVTYSIKSADGSNFKLNSFKIGQLVGSQSNVAISAYSNGILVASEVTINLTASAAVGNITYSFTTTDPDYGRYGTLMFNGAYDNVDEIRLAYASTADLHIDDINIGAFVSDPNAPVFSSAAVNGATLVMNYTDAHYLDGVNKPAPGAFAVTADGGSVAVNSVVIDPAAKTVTLTLASAVASGQAVTVAYTDPTGGNDANAIQDVSGNDAASLGATAVTNNTPDTTPPTVTSLSAPSDASYTVGQTLSFTVTFDENVNLSGSPSTLGLSIGGAAHVATVTGTTPNSITYGYTVQSGDADGDGISVTGISLNGGTIKDAAGNNANLSLTIHVPSLSAVLVDGVAPSVIGNLAVPMNGSYSAGQVLSFTIQFDENVIISGTDSELGLTIGSTARSAAFQSKTATSVTYAYQVLAGDNDANGIAVGAVALNGTTIKDSAGNDAILSLVGHVPSTAGILVDTTAPAVASVSVPANGTYAVGQNLDFMVVFDENVTITGIDSSLGLTIGSATHSAAFLSSAGNTVTYRYTVQAGDVDANGITVGGLNLGASAIRDAAGNNAVITLNSIAATTAVLVDGASPSVIGDIAVPVNGTYAVGDILNFTVTFDENVTVIGTDSSLALTIGNTSRSAQYASKSGNTITYSYTVQAGDDDGDGIAVGAIALGSTTIKDAAGNSASLVLTGHVPTLSAVLVDAVAPVLASAAVNGASLVMTYTEADQLDSMHAPAPGNFMVAAAGSSVAVTSVTIDAALKTVALTLATAVTIGEMVTVSYTDPTGANDTMAIQDRAGNDAASALNFAVTNNTPAAAGGTPPPDQDVNLSKVETAFRAITSQTMTSADAEKALAAIKNGEISFDAYVDKLIEEAKSTALPGLVMTQFFGTNPSEQHLSDLTKFSSAQLEFYTKMGVMDPALGPYEALGLGFSETQAFQSRYGALSDIDFLSNAYADVFGHAPGSAQALHFANQIAYFESLYAGAGQTEAQADLHARGAVLGQMVGVAAVFEAHSLTYDDAAVGFLKDAAIGQADYGMFGVL